MRGLEGKRVALLGTRRSTELGKLVENLGGTALFRPAQGTVFLDESNLEPDIRRLLEEDIDWIILTTGIGTETLFRIAENMGLENRLFTKLTRVPIAARGYKTVNTLRKLGLVPTVRDDDGTTADIIRTLTEYDLAGRRVVLQLYGETAPELVGWLKDRGAECFEVLPYRHIPPDPEIVQTLVAEIVGGRVDAVTFTNGGQVRFLMDYVREAGMKPRVLEAFGKGTVALAVGKVTAEALREEGITRVVLPEKERMGSMIVALCRYYERK